MNALSIGAVKHGRLHSGCPAYYQPDVGPLTVAVLDVEVVGRLVEEEQAMPVLSTTCASSQDDPKSPATTLP
jgi:hypothetical protein